MRRCANEIAKSFECPYSECGKQYGSEGSLNLHMKLKHNAGSKTEREKLAKSMLCAMQKGSMLQHVPPIKLPPGSLEKAAKNLGIPVPALEMNGVEISSRGPLAILEGVAAKTEAKGQSNNSSNNGSNSNGNNKTSKRAVLPSPLGERV